MGSTADEPRPSIFDGPADVIEFAALTGYSAYWIFRFVNRWSHEPAVAVLAAIAIPVGLIYWGWRSIQEADRLGKAAGLPETDPSLDHRLKRCLTWGAISILVVALLLPTIFFVWHGARSMSRAPLLVGLVLGFVGFIVSIRLYFQLLRRAAGEA